MMAPLPAALDASARLVGWRIDAAAFAPSWDSGIGAERYGGRWNPKGFKAVYCSLDPATCLVESAVHRGFKVLDTQAHTLTSFEVLDPRQARVVMPDEVPNPAWLHGGIPSSGQQGWGADMLAAHGFVLFPSAVSKRSWNLVFEPDVAKGKYRRRSQERLVVDTRLNQPA
jgi:RES domain-containing protein